MKENLARGSMGTANIRAEVVEIFSEIVNNAAEHGDSPEGARTHVRFMPHRSGHSFDVVVVDSGPGVRATLSRNPKLDVPESDAEAILLATQKLVSGTGDPTRGIGFWMIVTEIRRPGRMVMIHSGTGLLMRYGVNNPEVREIERLEGTLVRLTVPVTWPPQTAPGSLSQKVVSSLTLGFPSRDRH